MGFNWGFKGLKKHYIIWPKMLKVNKELMKKERFLCKKLQIGKKK